MKNILLIFIFGIFGLSAVYCQPPQTISNPKSISITKQHTVYTPPVSTYTPDPDALPPPPPLEAKTIYYVHGLGGSSNSWIKVADATENNHSIPGWFPRQANVARPGYSEIDLDAASYDLQIALKTDAGPVPLQNILIAHSQGGIVARQNDKYSTTPPPGQALVYDERYYNGIITFGSPHQGAQILNNSDPDDPSGANLAAKFANEACEELGAGIFEEGFNKSTPLKIATLFNEDLQEELLITACDLAQNAVSLVLQDHFPGITNDYKVGAPALANLSGGSAHRVGFYGIEVAPLIWRVTNSFKFNPPNSFGHFEANKDDHLFEPGGEVFDLTLKHQSKYDLWASVANFWKSQRCTWQWALPNAWPYCFSIENDYFDAIDTRNAYKRGVDWWKRADENYKELIGVTKSTQTTSQLYCECRDIDGIVSKTPISFPGDCISSPSPGIFCYTKTESTVTIVEKQSDGVVLTESAGNFPGAIDNVPLDLSNHQQIRNDRNTKTALMDVFEGKYGRFFITPKK